MIWITSCLHLSERCVAKWTGAAVLIMWIPDRSEVMSKSWSVMKAQHPYTIQKFKSQQKLQRPSCIRISCSYSKAESLALTWHRSFWKQCTEQLPQKHNALWVPSASSPNQMKLVMSSWALQLWVVAKKQYFQYTWSLGEQINSTVRKS